MRDVKARLQAAALMAMVGMDFARSSRPRREMDMSKVTDLESFEEERIRTEEANNVNIQDVIMSDRIPSRMTPPEDPTNGRYQSYSFKPKNEDVEYQAELKRINKQNKRLKAAGMELLPVPEHPAVLRQRAADAKIANGLEILDSMNMFPADMDKAEHEYVLEQDSIAPSRSVNDVPTATVHATVHHPDVDVADMIGPGRSIEEAQERDHE